jgi:hypothetical protein
MTLVRILSRATVYPDGISPVTYNEGQEIEATDGALAQLIQQGACEIVENKAIEVAPETKPVRGRKRAPKV